MNGAIKAILKIGINDSTPKDIVFNLQAATILNIVLTVILTVFIILFYFTASALVPLMVGGILFLIGSAALQSVGYHILARLISSVTIVVLGISITNIVLQQTKVMPYHFFAAMTLISLLPWYLFGIREAGYAASAFVLNALMLIVSPYTAHLFALSTDISAVGTPAIQIAGLVAGLILMGGSTFGLQALNRSESRKVARLLESLESENRTALDREKKLNEAMEQIKQAQQEEQKRMWANKGITEVGKLLRDEHDMQQLTDRLLSYLVRYLHANQAALFLVDENEQTLTLKGCFAYDRKKYLDKQISIGEGLLGECVMTKEYIYLQEVPEAYVKITSGLGFATPRALLLIPIMANQKVTGVMEFASFEHFQHHHINFLLDVGESVAISINHLQSAEQTKSLLLDSQTLAEQLRAQEEEMRQNMEELATTQEQQSRVEKDLQLQLAARDEMIAALRAELATNKVQELH